MPPARALPGPAEILRRLVAHDSTSSKSTAGIAGEIADLLDRPGRRVRMCEALDATKTNVLVEMGPACDPAHRDGLLLSGHMDVVPALEPEWRTEPFTLADGGDRWFGRGACDMKGFLALAIDRAARLEPASLRRPLTLLFTYDEEIGTLGAQDFASRFGASTPLPRAAVIGEPTSLRIVRQHKGHLKLRVIVRGRSAHSSQPQLGRNAIATAGRVLVGLDALRAELEAERPAGAEHFPEAPFVTLNAGLIQGGAAVNVVPDRCEITLGLRSLPGVAEGALVERVRAAVAAAAAAERADVEVVQLGASPAMVCPESSPACRALAEVTGERRTYSASFASDAGPLQALGVESVLFGPGSIEVAHRPNEYLPKAEFVRAGEILDILIVRMCVAPLPVGTAEVA